MLAAACRFDSKKYLLVWNMAILRATMCIFTSAESPALKVMLSLGVCVYIVKTTRAVSKMSCSGSVQ